MAEPKKFEDALNEFIDGMPDDMIKQLAGIADAPSPGTAVFAETATIGTFVDFIKEASARHLRHADVIQKFIDDGDEHGAMEEIREFLSAAVIAYDNNLRTLGRIHDNYHAIKSEEN